MSALCYLIFAMSATFPELRQKWQDRFAFFDLHGAPNTPAYKAALKALPSGKMKINFKGLKGAQVVKSRQAIATVGRTAKWVDGVESRPAIRRKRCQGQLMAKQMAVNKTILRNHAKGLQGPFVCFVQTVPA